MGGTRYSEVMFGSFPGSTEYLNQSATNVSTWLVYLESFKAEDYLTLKARLSHLITDLRRIYRERRLRPGGVLLKHLRDSTGGDQWALACSQSAKGQSIRQSGCKGDEPRSQWPVISARVWHIWLDRSDNESNAAGLGVARDCA